MFYLRNCCILLVVVPMFFASCMDQKQIAPQEDQKKFSKQDRIKLAIEQEIMMTKDPVLGYVPYDRLEVAKDYYDSYVGSSFRTTSLSWQERGPNNVPGRTRALFIDSRDATGNTVFAASVSGGIWKTTNFKSTPTWTPIAENMGSIAVCALAQDPSNPNVMYAGTGEGWFNLDAVRGNGIWKTTDGGATWAQLAATDSVAPRRHNFDYVQDIIVNNAGIVIASGRYGGGGFCNIGGVFRSDDNGASWTRVIGSIHNVDLNNIPPGINPCDSAYDFRGADLELASNGDMYATTGFSSGGRRINLGRIFRSIADSAGKGWFEITPSGDWDRIEMAVAPSDPNVLYALCENVTDGSIGAIKKSVNAGASWTDLPLPTWCSQGTIKTDFTNGQAFYDLIVNVDPTNANNVYIGGIDLFKSTNGGSSWTQITQWSSGCGSLPRIHADQHNLIFYPGSSSEIIATNDGGIFYTSNAGSSWTTKGLNYNTHQLYAIDVHPSATNYFLGGSQDNGSQRFSFPGINSTTEASKGGDGGFTHIDQNNPAYQFISYVFNNYYYSRDEGTTFTRVSYNEDGLFINPTDYDDVQKVMYTCNAPGTIGLWTNLTAGVPSLNPVTISSLTTGRYATAIKVDPTVTSGGTVWIGGTGGSSTASVLIKLSNLHTGTPTTLATRTLPSSIVPNGSYISSIDVDEHDANHLLITISSYGVVSVLESKNGGASWSNIEGNLPDVPVRWGIFIPSVGSVDGTTRGGILVATEVGVWYTPPTAGAVTWVPQTTGIPRVRVDMLRYRKSDGLLAAATHGRGLFTTNLTVLTPVAGVPTIANTKDFIRFTSANSQQLQIRIGNMPINKMQVRILDAKGSLLMSNDTKYADQSISIGHLPSGSYIIKIYGTRGEEYTRQFVK